MTKESPPGKNWEQVDPLTATMMEAEDVIKREQEDLTPEDIEANARTRLSSTSCKSKKLQRCHC